MPFSGRVADSWTKPMTKVIWFIRDTNRNKRSILGNQGSNGSDGVWRGRGCNRNSCNGDRGDICNTSNSCSKREGNHSPDDMVAKVMCIVCLQSETLDRSDCSWSPMSRGAVRLGRWAHHETNSSQTGRHSIKCLEVEGLWSLRTEHISQGREG